MFTGMNILVVDDEPDLREITAFEFEQYGANVLTAESGSKALDILSVPESRINLVVSDVRMPGGSGEKLLESMKSETRLADIPILLVTGFADLTRNEAIKKGALELFYKPVDWPELISFVDNKLVKATL